MSSNVVKKRLTKTVSSSTTQPTLKPTLTNVANSNKLERSYTTLGTTSDQTSVPTFASIGSSACYQREGSSLSTASLPATSPMKRTTSKSKIPLPTFSRESLSTSNSTLAVSTASLAESLTGAPAAKTFKSGLGGSQVDRLFTFKRYLHISIPVDIGSQSCRYLKH